MLDWKELERMEQTELVARTAKKRGEGGESYNVRVKEYGVGERRQVTVYGRLQRQGYKMRETVRMTLDEESKDKIKELKARAKRAIYNSQNRSKNKLYDLLRSNDWEWFVTLTFDPQKVDSYDYDETVKKLRYWLSNMRKKCPKMVYVVVPELHKSGRYHFHGCFSNCDGLEFEYSGIDDKKGRKIYNVGRYKLGFTTATKVEDTMKSANYMAKYITKELCGRIRGKKRYWHSKNCHSPTVIKYLDENTPLTVQTLEDVAQYKKEVETWTDRNGNTAKNRIYEI